MAKRKAKSTSGRYTYRHEVAREIILRGGSDEELQRRVMEEFPDSKENPTRAQWYRNRFKRTGECR